MGGLMAVNPATVTPLVSPGLRESLMGFVRILLPVYPSLVLFLDSCWVLHETNNDLLLGAS